MDSRPRLTRPERKAKTRNELLDAAAAVFARRGYQAATLDEVAEAAGYTKGAVYSNFDSKEDLFFALVDRRIVQESARLASRLSGAPAAAEPKALAGEPESGPDGSHDPQWSMQWLVLAIEFWLHAMRDERTRLVMADQYERFRELTADILDQAYQRAEVEPPMPTRDLAILIEAVGTGLGIQAALDPQRVQLSVQLEGVERLLGPEVFALAMRTANSDPATYPQATE